MSEGGVSPLPREARPYQGQRAGLVTRLAAAVLDGIVVVLVLVAGYAGASGLLFMVDPRGFSFPAVSFAFALTAGFVVSVVYLTAAWWISGRSYGCLVMGLRAVSRQERRMRLPVAFLRALICVLLPAGLLWVAVSRENRSVADVFLRTSVVYDWQPKGAPGRSQDPLEPF
ncbi:MAG TPA: RDD family protein [Nocardioidaceae bacterium]|nr:RDD family protein [Nocardioidaceae bacterium]